MLIDLVRLRQRGKRRSREEIRQTKPDRGVLYIDNVNRYGKRIIIASFTLVGKYEDGAPKLYYVVPPKLRGQNLLLEGSERVPIGGRHFQDYPQEWWCKLVSAEVSPERSPSQQQLQAQVHAELFGHQR